MKNRVKRKSLSEMCPEIQTRVNKAKLSEERRAEIFRFNMLKIHTKAALLFDDNNEAINEWWATKQHRFYSRNPLAMSLVDEGVLVLKYLDEQLALKQT